MKNYNDKQSSGFTHDISKETSVMAQHNPKHQFTQLTECLISKTGHTRMVAAVRYEKRYMLKFLKEEFMHTPLYHQAMVKEFEIGIQMDHPNICRTIGMEDIPGLGKAIVMDYIDGITLEEMIRSGQLTAEKAWHIAEQTADALDYMHSKQIVHRDLKPQNIMITHNGCNVRIIDFSLSDSDSFNILKLPAGTMGYIAPEQFKDGAKSDIRADVYSFGMILNELGQTVGDRRMVEMAEACTQINPQKRPSSKQQIWQTASKNHNMRAKLWIMIAITLMSIAFLAVSVDRFVSYKQNQEITTDTIQNSPMDNRIVEFKD